MWAAGCALSHLLTTRIKAVSGFGAEHNIAAPETQKRKLAHEDSPACREQFDRFSKQASRA
jgi:hypothetical protein